MIVVPFVARRTLSEDDNNSLPYKEHIKIKKNIYKLKLEVYEDLNSIPKQEIVIQTNIINANQEMIYEALNNCLKKMLKKMEDNENEIKKIN